MAGYCVEKYNVATVELASNQTVQSFNVTETNARVQDLYSCTEYEVQVTAYGANIPTRSEERSLAFNTSDEGKKKNITFFKDILRLHDGV